MQVYLNIFGSERVESDFWLCELPLGVAEGQISPTIYPSRDKPGILYEITNEIN
jgi:hypothetical protein